jgi:glucosamine--fructose-6-phosphate aminotransferase (isomerizing)
VCGIIAVVRRPDRHPPIDPAVVRARLDAAVAAADPTTAADAWAAVDATLRGVPGLRTLLAVPDLVAALDAATAQADDGIAEQERRLDAEAAALSDTAVEARNAALVRLKDAVWAVRHDRLRTAAAVADLAGPDAGPSAVAAYGSVQVALSALDRLEVRGRDSAGLHVFVRGHGLDLSAPDLLAAVGDRGDDPLFTSGAVRTPNGDLSFVYKAAAEIGDLGDNSRALRDAVRGDELLRRAVAADGAEVVVLGHTRWASVGIISQPNAHPLNQEEEDRDGPYVTAALNGDVDNYAELQEREGLRLPPEVTTDAKVIPALVSRRLAEGFSAPDAFRRTVASFEGSVAVAAHVADDPSRLLLALRGSGQALYVGLADDAFVVASEPYGVVEETGRYVRMDGESGGEVLVLDAERAGEVAGIRRIAYDGTESTVGDADVQTAEITTRDIDRGGYPHYLLKELSEAPQSFRKTLRGRIVEDAHGRLAVRVGDDTLPAALRQRLRDGGIRRVLVIGQGTAAVAGQSVAASIADVLDGRVQVEALPATELSGFELEDDMSDALVVAISQSGTTTDTNRTVDLVRARGAAVIAVVNRRNSDLVEKSDGVLYTSDGRDVEMSVASTKAFYAQLAAGFVLAEALGAEVGVGNGNGRTAELLAGLRALPDAMDGVLARRDDIAQAAMRHAPSRRYWAIVGNGANRIAAQEIRIKLSELCYKSIACDVTEDKKHIDLSSEPLILVCAAGLTGPTADDVAKEVAIYRAHKAAPVVVATEGEERFTAAVHTIAVPPAHPALAFVLAAMAGHLFGYEAALSIDAQARPLREARAAVESVVSLGLTGDALLRRLAAAVEQPAARFSAGLREGAYNGHMEASTAVRLASLLRYSTGVVPLDAYELEYGKVGTPGALVDDLVDALTRGIEELTRPVDAIKHQAKTVTVGISRSEEALFAVPLVQSVLTAGAPRDRLGYKALRVLGAVERAVAEVTGWTRYRIEGNPAEPGATVHVIDQGGVARTLSSRTAANPALRGTKHQAAAEREVLVARGRSDDRTVVMVPEAKDNQATGLTLLHVRFHDRLAPAEARQVLEGYRGRWTALVDAVTETEPTFDEDRLADVPVVDLLLEPIQPLADRWRRS